MLRGLFILSALLFLAEASIHDKYQGYKVYQVWMNDVKEAEFVQNFIVDLNLDRWDHGAIGDRPARLMVDPGTQETLLKTMKDSNIRYAEEIPDVAQQLKLQDAELTRYRSARRNRKAFEDYPRYAEVMEYIEYLADKYPNIVTLELAAPSFEGLPIKYLKLSTTSFNDASKPVFFLDAMIHAREWVTTPTVLYGLHRLLEEPTDEDRWLLENINWIILPIVNPDGYEYSHTVDRMWRGTRSIDPTVDTVCLGVDGNRNFDIQWNTTGVSTNPCSQTYPGSHPFSEPETRNIRDLIHEYQDRMHFYMNIHSHGNYILYAYGDGSNPANTLDVHFVGAAMGAKIDVYKLPAARYYLVGNSARMLYGTSGSAQDYAAKVGVPLSYTLELPGLGYAFQVPPENINHMNMETWDGIAEAARLTRFFYDRDQSTN